MTLERLTIENLSDIREAGRVFLSDIQYPGGFDFEALRTQWEPLLTSGVGEIFVSRVGGKAVAFLGAAYVPDGFSGWLTAMEQFWFCLPEHRGGSAAFRLFRAFEDEAARRGCRKIVMVHLLGPSAEKLEKIYRSRGYAPIEQTFCKLI